MVEYIVDIVARFLGILVLIGWLWSSLEVMIYGYSESRAVDLIIGMLWSATIVWFLR